MLRLGYSLAVATRHGAVVALHMHNIARVQVRGPSPCMNL